MELEFRAETVIQQPKIPLRNKLKTRIRETYRYDHRFWRMSMAGPCGAGIFAFALAALGMPTGLGIAMDIGSFTFMGTVAIFLASHLIALLLTLTALPAPRLYIGTVLANSIAVFTVFFYENKDLTLSAIISLFIMLAAIVTGLMCGMFASRTIPFRIKACLAGLLIAGCLAAAVWPSESSKPAHVEEQPTTDMALIAAENPSSPGTYPVNTYHYGSGHNFWHPEFGRDADLITGSVDASAYIEKWSNFRTKYWGFNEQQLPLNGRVWMPEGNGPFPLVLIVHGNHLMEDFSDGGYAYLGDLLASRGFIAVSVDENFLNYSAWTGIPDQDMKVRAWMMLKHLQQIAVFADTPDTPFYERVDFEQIALIGHSRGGQAVAMASDYKRWFNDDAGLTDMDRFKIRSIVAISPTDKKVDHVYAKLSNVNYLTIQGARDADVTEFEGDRQYARTTFSNGNPAFKSSLYIGDANHSQFNTNWGRLDISYPKGVLLNRSPIMPAAEQRMIAKVYISAFLEATLHGQEQYIPLFQDYRAGLSWLPETSYYNRYESGLMTLWADFDEDRNRMSLPSGGIAEGKQLIWREEDVKNRRQSSKDTRGLLLERASGRASESLYTMGWETAAPLPKSEADRLLSFSLSDHSYQLKSKDHDSPAEQLNIEIELQTRDGISVRLPLADFMPLAAPPEINYTLHPWLDLKLSDGKYKNSTEAVFQTYHLPLSTFTAKDSRFDPSAGITKLSFVLTGGPGRIMLDDIGIY